MSDTPDATDMTMTTSTPETDRELIRSEYTIEERERMLARMTEIKDSFYVAAQRVGHHPFLEFVGLMNEYIKICTHMHNEGIDFGTAEFAPKDYEMAYVGEKFDCIFGDALVRPEIRTVFLKTLASKGGWRS